MPKHEQPDVSRILDELVKFLARGQAGQSIKVGDQPSLLRQMRDAARAGVPVEGHWYPDDENPGCGRARLTDGAGEFDVSGESRRIGPLEAEARRDLQSEGPLDWQLIETRPAAEGLPNVPADPDHWEVVTAADRPLDERAEALSACALEDAARTAVFVAEQLACDGLDPQWRFHLVFAAESLQFVGPALRRQVAACLYQAARRFRNTALLGADRAVWSALRTYASLSDKDRVATLSEFLDGEGTIDTRLVALQCVARMLESGPPIDAASCQPLADTVFAFATKCLDPFVMTPGELAAVALNAVHALAALGDPRLREAIACVVRLRKAWFTRQVRHRLAELLDQWERREIRTDLIREAIGQLDTALAGQSA